MQGTRCQGTHLQGKLATSVHDTNSVSPSYYELLGLSPQCSADDVRRAYRQVAVSMHPDRHPDKPGAEDAFKRINEAYAVLRDPQRRRAYDRAWQKGGRSEAGQGAAEGIDMGAVGDMIEGFFGDMFRGRKQKPAGDIEYHVSVPFEEAALGAERLIRVRRHVQRDKDEPARVVDEQLVVRIPPGVLDGAVRTIREKGHRNPFGAGALHIHVHVEEHRIFSRRGSDVFCVLPVRYTQVALGSTVEVPILGGTAQLRIPAGTPSGKVFRMRGKGIAVFGGYGRGDQLVEVRVEVPTQLNESQRALLAELDAAFDSASHPSRQRFLEDMRAMNDRKPSDA